MAHCINIDWLECYCLEIGEPHDIDYFGRCGFFVKLRDYGTRHWVEVFTIYDTKGDPFMEVRRHPRSQTGKHTILPDNACTLRLVNRYCYFDNAAEIMLEFITRYQYEFRRIFRMDLCCDFERFDSGDYPDKVVKRILAHTYAKVYQAKRTVHGDDRWNGSIDNSLSWGNKNSMIVTRFYNKTMELEEQGFHKPWIIQAWFEFGLIDNPMTITRKNSKGEDYRPDIWRLEFQINSSARGYVQIDTDRNKFWLEHNLEIYLTRDHLVQPYSVLQQHYFQWRIFQKGKRKYDCPEKKLFVWENVELGYKLVNMANERIYTPDSRMFLRQLYKMRENTGNMNAIKAINKLIQYYEDRLADDFKEDGISPRLLQLLMVMKDPQKTIEKAAKLADELF